MNGCFHRTRPGDHFPEHGLDLLAYTVFIKIGKEQTLIGQNRLQLVFEGLRVTNNNILSLFRQFFLHRIWSQFIVISCIIYR